MECDLRRQRRPIESHGLKIRGIRVTFRILRDPVISFGRIDTDGCWEKAGYLCSRVERFLTRNANSSVGVAASDDVNWGNEVVRECEAGGSCAGRREKRRVERCIIKDFDMSKESAVWCSLKYKGKWVEFIDSNMLELPGMVGSKTTPRGRINTAKRAA